MICARGHVEIQVPAGASCPACDYFDVLAGKDRRIGELEGIVRERGGRIVQLEGAVAANGEVIQGASVEITRLEGVVRTIGAELDAYAAALLKAHAKIDAMRQELAALPGPTPTEPAPASG